MEIKLYNDIVFKWVFGRQENTRPIIYLLNAVTQIPGKFSDIQILNPFDRSEPFKNEKQGILDIRGKESETGNWFDLEVQVINRIYYFQRSKYYLAGLYREQLEKDAQENYWDLRPCYGIHILVQTQFHSGEEAEHWYNHYAMLNTRTFNPLVNHWHLYYIELEKFLSKCRKQKLETELEQWAYFLAHIQDNNKPLDEKVRNNEAIQEVYAMLKTFTEDDHLREQYRVQEEFLRDQRTFNALFEQVKQEKETERRQKEAALKAQENERKEKEAERSQKEAAHREKAQLLTQSIKFMHEKGSTKQELAEYLDISPEQVEEIFKKL